jgi:hypothetical protein
MPADKKVEDFLFTYSNDVYNNALQLRSLIISTLSNVIEQLDIPAKMVAYCYGRKYAEMICTIIPSKKGLKLGFYKGMEMHDPYQLLKGTGKLSRYVEIKSEEQINFTAIKQLLETALAAYKQRVLINRFTN